MSTTIEGTAREIDNVDRAHKGNTQAAAGRKLYGGGETLPEECSTEDMLMLSGNDFEVEKRPLLVGHEHGAEWVDDFVATVRTDTDAVLGIVTPEYEPIQNADAFHIMDDGIVEAGAGTWVAGGTFREGRRVWGMLALEQEFQAAGDLMRMNALYINDHTGSRAITSLLTPIRPYCTNMMNLVIAKAISRIGIRHVGDVTDRFAEAGKVLEAGEAYAQEFTATADELGLVRATPTTLKRWLEALYPAGDDDKATKRAVDNRDAVRRVLGESENLEGHRENGWGFVNAVNEYALWHRDRRGDTSRVAQVVGGQSTDQQLTNRALQIVTSRN